MVGWYWDILNRIVNARLHHSFGANNHFLYWVLFNVHVCNSWLFIISWHTCKSEGLVRYESYPDLYWFCSIQYNLCILAIFTALCLIMYVLLVYDGPSNHPRISRREKRYIDSGIGDIDRVGAIKSDSDMIRLQPEYLCVIQFWQWHLLGWILACHRDILSSSSNQPTGEPLTARFVWPMWGPPGATRT